MRRRRRTDVTAPTVLHFFLDCSIALPNLHTSWTFLYTFLAFISFTDITFTISISFVLFAVLENNSARWIGYTHGYISVSQI